MMNARFFLHMDRDYSWRWFCVDQDGKLLAISFSGYFSLDEAKQRIDEFRAAIEPDNDD